MSSIVLYGKEIISCKKFSRTNAKLKKKKQLFHDDEAPNKIKKFDIILGARGSASSGTQFLFFFFFFDGFLPFSLSCVVSPSEKITWFCVSCHFRKCFSTNCNWKRAVNQMTITIYNHKQKLHILITSLCFEKAIRIEKISRLKKKFFTLTFFHQS